jgi:foldase protein PrsA
MSRRVVSEAARRVAALGAALLLLGGLAGCGQSSSGDVVARVGGDGPITGTTLDHWISVLAGKGAAADRQSPQDRALQARVLSFLISAQWTLGEANELKVKASDEEARAQLELLHYDQREDIPYEGIPQQGEIPAFFAKAHDHADRLWLMKLAMLTTRVQARHLADAERTITHAQIASYYDQHTVSFVLPERRDLQWIVTYSLRKLQNAVAEIRAGKNFVAVARRASLDPPTISGMELASAPEKDFARHVFAAKPHVIVGPFRQSQNHYMLEVTKVTPARQQTLAQSESSIRLRLGAAWAASGLREATERKWTARTSCWRGFVVRQCREHPRAAA